MKCTLMAIGKTAEPWLKTGMAVYQKRLPHYLPFTYVELPDVKHSTKLEAKALKAAEGLAFLSRLETTDHVILLDERGKQCSSRQFSELFAKHQLQGTRRLVFIIGGAYGFSEELYDRANQKLALSSMTFSHQMVRVIALEQLYRAQSILRGEPYHHD